MKPKAHVSVQRCALFTHNIRWVGACLLHVLSHSQYSSQVFSGKSESCLSAVRRSGKSLIFTSIVGFVAHLCNYAHALFNPLNAKTVQHQPHWLMHGKPKNHFPITLNLFLHLSNTELSKKYPGFGQMHTYLYAFRGKRVNLLILREHFNPFSGNFMPYSIDSWPTNIVHSLVDVYVRDTRSTSLHVLATIRLPWSHSLALHGGTSGFKGQWLSTWKNHIMSMKLYTQTYKLKLVFSFQEPSIQYTKVYHMSVFVPFIINFNIHLCDATIREGNTMTQCSWDVKKQRAILTR